MQLSLISDVGSDATLTKSSGDTQVRFDLIILHYYTWLPFHVFHVGVILMSH